MLEWMFVFGAMFGRDIRSGSAEYGIGRLDQRVADGLGEMVWANSGWADAEKVADLFTELSGREVIDAPVVPGIEG